MDFSFPFDSYHFKKRKDLNIEDEINQPPNNLTLRQK